MRRGKRVVTVRGCRPGAQGTPGTPGTSGMPRTSGNRTPETSGNRTPETSGNRTPETSGSRTPGTAGNGKAGVLDAVAELFDLPADVVAGLPRLEMIGCRQLYLEHHTGILSYSEERIDANTDAGVLCVRGQGLTLLAMTADELRLGGTILSVTWEEGMPC